MDASQLLEVEKFKCPDDYVRTALLRGPGIKSPVKLCDIRRLAASCGVSDVMKKGKEEIIKETAEVIGWKEIYEKAVKNFGAMRRDFLKLGITKNDFRCMCEAEIVRGAGKYRYTLCGITSYSPLYNIYDYFSLKDLTDKKGKASQEG